MANLSIYPKMVQRELTQAFVLKTDGKSFITGSDSGKMLNDSHPKEMKGAFNNGEREMVEDPICVVCEDRIYKGVIDEGELYCSECHQEQKRLMGEDDGQ